MATPQLPPNGRDGPRGVVVPLRSAEDSDPNWDPSFAFDSETAETPRRPEKQEPSSPPASPRDPGPFADLAGETAIPEVDAAAEAPAQPRKTAPVVWIGLAVAVAGGLMAAVLGWLGRNGGGPASPAASAPP